MKSTATLAASAAVLPFAGAQANAQGADAELKELWRQYLDASMEANRTANREEEASDAARKSIAKQVEALKAKKKAEDDARGKKVRELAETLEISVRGVDVREEVMRDLRGIIASISGPKRQEFKAIEEIDRLTEEAEARHNVPELEDASREAFNELRRIEETICETAAEGIEGLAIKLAIESALGVEASIYSAYRDCCKMTGTDYEAELLAAEKRGRA